jgi:hypothetical protein
LDNQYDPQKETAKERINNLLTPLSKRGWPTWVIYALSIIGLIYILNPGAGIIELLPDNIPFLGNLDEGIAFLLLWYGIVEFFEGRK